MKTFLLFVGIATFAACGSNSNNNNGGDAGTDASTAADMTPGCVSNPTTHIELLNACTTAESYDKQPFYPTLAPNGQLPSLP